MFVVTDPQGRRVSLSDDRWQQYILRKRPFLSTMIQEIQEAITQPQAIYVGNKPFSLLYVGKPFPSGFHKGEMIRVAVSFDRAYRYGRVRTAYITSQSYRGVLVWTP